MRISELTTETHPLMLIDLERMTDECRSMIQDIEIEILTQPLSDEEEYLRYAQLDALVFLIRAFQMRIKERSFLYN
jgi:NifB/MoaA-like Fe-S oxidoreductase